MKDFVIALTYPVKGLAFIWSNKPLLKLAVLPVLMNLGFFLIFLLGFHFLFTENVFPLIEFGEAWYYSILEWLLFSLAWLLLVLAAAIASFLVTNILSALILETLSIRTESIVSGGEQAEEPQPFSLSRLVEPAIAEIKRYGIYLLALLVILPLNLLPVIGYLLYFCFFALISSFFFAYEFFDHTLSRRNMDFGRKKEFILGNKASSLGFGFSVFLFFFIPFAAILVVPSSVVGATLLICSRTGKP